MSALENFKPLFIGERLIYFAQYDTIYNYDPALPAIQNPLIINALCQKYNIVRNKDNEEICPNIIGDVQITAYPTTDYTEKIIVSRLPIETQLQAKKLSLSINIRDDWRYQPKPWQIMDKLVKHIPDPNEFNWQYILSSNEMIDMATFYISKKV
jgi:hypothetical protein